MKNRIQMMLESLFAALTLSSALMVSVAATSIAVSATIPTRANCLESAGICNYPVLKKGE